VPLVSVIMPAYNMAPYLSDAVESVRAQTFSDWELLIVDDGSTDDTAAIARGYSVLDGRVRLVRQENRGISAARNAALRVGRGAFFSLLDSDDLWDPEFLAAQLDVFEAHPATALVSGSARLLGGPRHGQPARPELSGTPMLSLEEMIADERAVFVMTTFRREVVDRIGMFDVEKQRSEDWDFWLRAVVAGFVLRRNWRALGWYRIREGSLSQNTPAMLEEMLHTLAKVHHACANRPAARPIIDAQIARFRRERLIASAKEAFERDDLGSAATQLQALRSNQGGALVALTAWLARHVPPAARAAYRLRYLRPRWLRT
jgi:GT2 family glycosyltransferase